MLDKPKALIYLKRQSLDIYLVDFEVRQSVQFPESTISNLEIIDLQELENLLTDFIDKQNLDKYNAVIALSEGVIFQKNILKGQIEDKEKISEEFFASVPFAETDLIKRQINTQKEIILIAASEKFYQIIRSAFEKCGWIVIGVIPATLFPIQDQNILSSSEVKDILSGDLDSSFNLLKEMKVESQKADPEEKLQVEDQKIDQNHQKYEIYAPPKKSTKKPLIIGGLFFLVIAILAAFVFGVIKRPKIEEQKSLNQTDTEQTTIEITSTPESSPTARITQVNKEDLKVKILNGTGIKGQAGKVKSIISSLGFEQIQTANAASSDKEAETFIAFSDKISDQIKKEIIQELEKTFAKVTTTNNLDPGIDILITTGKELTQ